MLWLDAKTTLSQREIEMGASNFSSVFPATLAFLRVGEDRPVDEFSGGWRMRISLAKA